MKTKESRNIEEPDYEKLMKMKEEDRKFSEEWLELKQSNWLRNISRQIPKN